MGLQDYEAKTLPSWKMPDESLFYLHRISHMTSRDNHVTSMPRPPCLSESPLMALLQKWQVTEACRGGLNRGSRPFLSPSNTALGREGT